MSLQAEASYHEAAVAIHACVLPVATAWRIAQAHANPPTLYQKDRLHPTPIGTLLSAMSVTRGLLGEGAVRSSGPAGDRSGEELSVLEETTREAQSQESLRCVPIDGVPDAGR
jgi:hypothetical protein